MYILYFPKNKTEQIVNHTNSNNKIRTLMCLYNKQKKRKKVYQNDSTHVIVTV